MTILPILECINKFSYEEYKTKTNTPMPKMEWAQKVGMLLVAIEAYTNLPPEQAYLKFIEDSNAEHRATTELFKQKVQHNIATNCSGCGGGKVL